MLVSVTTAKTGLLVIVLITYYSTSTFVMKNPCHKVGTNSYHHCSSTAFQSQSFHRKIFQQDFIFFLILIYFLRTPFGLREWACGLWIVYLVYLFFSYLSYAFVFFDETCVTIFFMYPLQAQQFTN